MKKLNKKGFTIVELVIVIAVIAILAGVLIPTFSSIIKKANLSKAQQTANAEFKEALIECLADDGLVTAYVAATGTEGQTDYVPASGDKFGTYEVKPGTTDGQVVIETENFKFTVTSEGELKDIKAKEDGKFTGYTFTTDFAATKAN